MDWAHQRDAAGRNSCPGDPFGSLCIHNNGIFAALPFLWRWEYGLDASLLREHYPFLRKLLGFWDCHLNNTETGTGTGARRGVGMGMEIDIENGTEMQI